MNISLGLQNAGASSLSSGVTSFGQVFAQGELQAGQGLMAIGEGVSLPVQVDVKTTWPDGSAKMAVVSLVRPDLAAGQELTLSLTSGAPLAAPAIDMAAALQNHSYEVTLKGASGTTKVDVLEALQEALADGSASFWQNGPLATQARVEIPLEGSQRLVFDITIHADGGMSVEAQFNNDIAMGASGGRVDYEVTVEMNGRVVTQESISQGQYQNWHVSHSTDTVNGGQGLGSPEEGWLNIRHDVGYLQEVGVVANYNLDLQIAEHLLNEMGNSALSEAWQQPLAVNDIAQYMPGVGGRADIGMTTMSTTAWLISGDARAAAYAMGQAEAASSIPWNMWDAANKAWLNTDDYPNLWTDARGGSGSPGDRNSGTLTQHYDGQDGWTLDSAHQPDLSYVPYLLTGERWVLDNLTAQASWNVVSQWNAIRENDHDLLVQNNQVRGAAWSLRQIDEAAWAAPDGSAEKAYLTSVSEANWSWIVSKLPEWTEMQGEAYGWLPGEYGTAGALPPWQQDYFASTAIAAARQGNADALTYVEWASNFLVGRFLQEDNGFTMHDGAAYLLAISDPATGRVFQTWAEIGATTESYNWSNGDGWARSEGDYVQLALATLAGIAELTGSQEAAQAYHAIMADNPPFVGDSTFTKEPTNAIKAPELGDGMPVPAPAPAPIPQDPEVPGTGPLPAEPVPEPLPPEPAPQTAELTISLGSTAWEGHPTAVVYVDGVEAYRGTIYAAHFDGGTTISLGQVAIGQEHQVRVSLLDDLWGGSVFADRNIYVEDIQLGGVSTGQKGVLLNNGDIDFQVGGRGQTVELKAVLATDAFEGNAFASIQVDGVTVFHGEVWGSPVEGGITVSLGQFAATAAHEVTVSYLNDLWGGSATADRNLHVLDILVDGESTGSRAAMTENGDRVFTVSDQQEMVGLKVVLGSESWEGDAEAIVSVDGVQAFRGLIAASHAEGGAPLDLGYYSANTEHKVTVEFVNDAWGGDSSTDRNLHVEDVLVNGQSTGQSAALLQNGQADFVVPASPGKAEMAILMSGDAFEGNPFATVAVNGQNVWHGEVVYSHRDGGVWFNLGQYATDVEHEVTVTFANDAWGGHAGADRNLYVDNIRFNGVETGQQAELLDNGSVNFTLGTPDNVWA